MFNVTRKHFYIDTTLKYTELEYIESSGTLWIDTGINLNDNTLEMSFYLFNTNVDNLYIFQAGSSYDNAMVAAWANAYSIGWNRDVADYLGLQLVGNHTLIYNKQNGTDRIVQIDNSTLLTKTIAPSEGYSIRFLHRPGTGITTIPTRLYYAKLTNRISGDILFDIIPAKDPAGIVCMYDKVSNTFLYNQGTGNFIAGPVVREVKINDLKTKFLVTKELLELALPIPPAGYIELEYIESTGTQWIDTLINSSYAGKWEMDVNAQSTVRRFIGVDNQVILATPNSSTSYYPYYYNGWKDYSASVDITLKNNLVFLFANGLLSLKVNGTTIHTSSSTTSFSPSPIYVFKYNGPGYEGGIKLYYLKMYDLNDKLLRDFISVKDSSGVACMYDKVSKLFFYNQGTGDFIAGPVKGQL